MNKIAQNQFMTIAGNLFLVISALAYIALTATQLSKQPHSGDYAVGYAWTILLLSAVLILGLSVVVVITAAKGGFSWVSSTGPSRFFIVFICFAAVMGTTILSIIFENEGGPAPAVLKVFSPFAAFVFPVVLIVCTAILLNRVGVPAAVYKYPLLIISILGVVCMTVAIAGFSRLSYERQKDRLRAMNEEGDSNQRRILSEIDSCDLSKNMVFLFVFTDANQDQVVKERALVKIKTDTAWQQQIIRCLKNDWAPEAFTFLASNPVDNPELFTEPIREGIIIQAKLIRERIRKTSHPSNFYPGLFYWETERVLRTVNRFPDFDFTNEVKTLRSALDEPSGFEKPLFNCTGMLDKWLKKNTKK